MIYLSSKSEHNRQQQSERPPQLTDLNISPVHNVQATVQWIREELLVLLECVRNIHHFVLFYLPFESAGGYVKCVKRAIKSGDIEGGVGGVLYILTIDLGRNAMGVFKAKGMIITSAIISIDLAVVRMMYQVGLMHYKSQ